MKKRLGGETIVAAVLVAVCGTALVRAQETPYKAGSTAYSKCYGLYRKRQYKEAGPAYEAYLREHVGHPSRNTAFYYAVLCYRYAKRVDDVVRVAAEHRKTFGNTPEAFNSMMTAAQTLYNAKRYEEGAKLCEKMLADASYSGRYTLWQHLANCYYRLKQYDKCVDVCDRYVAAYPAPASRAAEMLNRKIGYLQSLNRYADIEAVASQVEKLLPNSTYSGYAWERAAYAAYYRVNPRDYGRASRLYAKAGAVASYNNADTCMRMAAYALRQGKNADFKGAAALYEEFLKKYPGTAYDAQVRLDLAYVYGRNLKDTASEVRVREEFDKLYGDTAMSAQNLIGIVNAVPRDKKLLGKGMRAAKRLVADYPNTAQAEQALYWLAELSKKNLAYSRNKIVNEDRNRAIKRLKLLLERFPSGAYAERAQKMLDEVTKR